MAKKKKTSRKTSRKTKPELYFVELSAKSTPFEQIVFGNGTLYGLDDSGRVFAYADGHGWYQVENDNRRFLVGTKREEGITPRQNGGNVPAKKHVSYTPRGDLHDGQTLPPRPS